MNVGEMKDYKAKLSKIKQFTPSLKHLVEDFFLFPKFFRQPFFLKRQMRERNAVPAAAALAAVGVVLLVAASAVHDRLEAVERMQVLVPVQPFPAQREFENFEVVVSLSVSLPFCSLASYLSNRNIFPPRASTLPFFINRWRWMARSSRGSQTETLLICRCRAGRAG